MFNIVKQLLRMVIPEQQLVLLKLLGKIVRLPKSENERLEVLLELSKRVYPRYRFKWPSMEWWDDDKFTGFLSQFDEQDGLNTDRKWMIYQLVRLVQNVPGDTVECGVFTGASSYLICHSNHHNRKHEKSHYMFDSYEGLSDPGEHDGEYWSEGNLSFSMQDLENTFSKFENKHFLKGWIPEAIQ